MAEGGELSDLELIRQKNLKEQEEFLKSCFDSDEDLAETLKYFHHNSELSKENFDTNPKKRKRSSKTYRRSNKDTLFTAKIVQLEYLERRKSSRLQNKKPEYSVDYLDDYDENFVLKNNDVSNLEKQVFRKKRIIHRKPISISRSILTPEEVTDEMLENISRKVSEKVYSENGTSCHQCRQKTLDTKTICRNQNCVGVRGQFCGVCIINRYGEDAATALKDPNWVCFPCREICNCSFCRRRNGKCPTGILTPMAIQNGYKSVNDFLVSLRGKGDWILADDDAELLGFDTDLTAHLKEDGKIRKVPYKNEEQNLNDIIKKLENYKKDDEISFKGFSADE